MFVSRAEALAHAENKIRRRATLVPYLCIVLIPGPAGRNGLNGRDGKDGVGLPGRDGRNGLNGRDSLAPGPMSTVTPSPGAQGEKGAKGDPGPACPVWQDHPSDPRYEICTRPKPSPTPTP